MEVLCPFCLKEHSTNECKQEGKDPKRIPQSYIKKVAKGVPVYPIIVIGYKGCGKTTFLCSFVYSLFESHFFHIEPLDEDTINRIRHDYYPTLVEQKTFLPPTSAERVFEEPLLIELNIKQKRRFGSANREIILLMYDVSGETYKGINNVVAKLPFIAQVPNLVLLIDLYSMYATYQDRLEIELQSIVSTIKKALDEFDSSIKNKNAIVCFTKSDECWDKEGFGPLAKKDNLSNNFEEYCKNMVNKSNEIEKFLKGNSLYDDFYRSIVKDFGSWFFIDTSSVGGSINHEKNTFNKFSPYRVIDPILWLLND